MSEGAIIGIVSLIVVYLLFRFIKKNDSKDEGMPSSKTDYPPELDVEVTPEMMHVDCPSTDTEVDELFAEKKVDDVFLRVMKELFPTKAENNMLLKYHKTQVFRYTYRVEEFGTPEDLMNLGRHQYLVDIMKKNEIDFQKYLVFGIYYDLFDDLLNFHESYGNDPIAIEKMIADI